MKSSKFTLLIFISITFCFLNISKAQWVQINFPQYGFTDLVVSDNNLFAGNIIGVYLSTNNGNSWAAVYSVPEHVSIYSLLVSGTNLFAGLGTDFSGNGGGVIRSTNNGTNWTSAGLSQILIHDMIGLGTNLFAAGGHEGVFRSTNNGSSWTHVSPLQIFFDIDAFAVSGTNLFASSFGIGIFRSTNYGTNWTRPLDNDNITNIAVSGSNLLASACNYFTGIPGGVLRSADNGSTWTVINAGFTNTDVYALEANENNVFVGSLNNGFYLSTDNGTSWTQRNEGLGNHLRINRIGVSNNYIFATASLPGGGELGVYRRPLPNLSSFVNQPSAFQKWVSGEQNTIQWTEKEWTSVNIKCILNVDAEEPETIIIATNIPNNSGYVWTIPTTLLSFRSKIVIENVSNPSEKIESDIFRIKPYLLTRVNPDSTYYEYRKNRDQWGFENSRADMFPESWYTQFNYQGEDPFTGRQYSQTQGAGVFSFSSRENFPDWVSWVNTFTIDACYISTSLPAYSPTALDAWAATKDISWDGSCFGISIANGLVFRNKDGFTAKYSSFPSFSVPINVISSKTNSVKKIINELFSHQYGQPHSDYRDVTAIIKKPTETLNEIKTMLLSENDPVRTLGILGNMNQGGHALLPYKVLKDDVQPDKYYIYVYDSKYPDSNVPIIVNTSENGGNGSWYTTDWPGWGGNEWMYLRDPANSYLVNPTLDIIEEKKSPFILSNDRLKIFSSKNASVVIRDSKGNITGFINDTLYVNIPESSPLISDNSSESPPYGYSVPTDNYSVIMSNFSSKTLNAFFFTGNKTFSYKRNEAFPTQTDRLYFDGGLSVTNPDIKNKTINLRNIINETTQEKVFSLRSIDLLQNDSIKIENEETDNFKFISYGSPKNYDIELNMVKETEIGRFGVFNVSLPVNSSHTLHPDWNNIYISQLIIYEDLGNNGTIDDTITLNNQVGVNGNGSLYLPESYSLSQNYPNPFNPTTVIKFDIKNKEYVTLRVFNILGTELTTLVNEVKEAGSYEIEFNGSALSSGIYYYRLEAGDFVATKKMIILK